MTSLLDRARAAYASDQEERQRAYDRETDRLVAQFREDMTAICARILDMSVLDSAVMVEARDGGTLFYATATIDGMTFVLARMRGDDWTTRRLDNPLVYAVLPCIGCGEEFTNPIRSLRDLGRVLDDLYCVRCDKAHRLGVQP